MEYLNHTQYFKIGIIQMLGSNSWNKPFKTEFVYMWYLLFQYIGVQLKLFLLAKHSDDRGVLTESIYLDDYFKIFESGEF